MIILLKVHKKYNDISSFSQADKFDLMLIAKYKI